MRLPIVLVAMAAASPLLARAEAPPPDPSLNAEPQADTSPTGFSCTTATLLAGEDCVFESEARPSPDAKAQAAANVEAARRLADEACRGAARVGGEVQPDADVLAVCLQASARAVEACALGGKLPLLDAESRFAPAARDCYQTLAETMRRTRLMASVSANCCRCAVANRCAKSGQQCNRDLTAGTPRLSPCEATKCAEACSAFAAPAAGEPEEEMPALPPSPTRLKTL